MLERRIAEHLKKIEHGILEPIKRSSPILGFDQTSNLMQDPSSRANLLGRFYESLTCTLYGGKLQRHFDRLDEATLIRPDVIDEERKTIGESKACVIGKRPQLLDTQMEAYKSLQASKPNFR